MFLPWRCRPGTAEAQAASTATPAESTRVRRDGGSGLAAGVGLGLLGAQSPLANQIHPISVATETSQPMRMAACQMVQSEAIATGGRADHGGARYPGPRRPLIGSPTRRVVGGHPP